MLPHRPTRSTRSSDVLGIVICNQAPLSPVVIIELDEVTLRASLRRAGHRLHLDNLSCLACLLSFIQL